MMVKRGTTTGEITQYSDNGNGELYCNYCMSTIPWRVDTDVCPKCHHNINESKASSRDKRSSERR